MQLDFVCLYTACATCQAFQRNKGNLKTVISKDSEIISRNILFITSAQKKTLIELLGRSRFYVKL